MVVAGLDHDAAVVLQGPCEIVDRGEDFTGSLVIRCGPRSAGVVGACHRRGVTEDRDVDVERVVEPARLLEQALPYCVEGIGVDVLERHRSMLRFSRAASV